MLRNPTATTSVAAVIGDPVAHSLSPVLHNAAFRELGLDWVYVAFPVARGGAGAAVEAMRTLGLAGLSVTMPHKADGAAAVDELTPVAARLGVVNTVSWSRRSVDSHLVGDSTDGAGFLAALAEEGFHPAGRDCVVLGAGGAARAVALALADAGAAAVRVVARRAEDALAVAALAGPGGAVVAAAELEAAVAGASLLVNATPVGMDAGDGLPLGIDPGWIAGSHFVADLVYAPPTTALLAAARRAGARRTNGLGMLIHQAALQFETWTGRPAPLEAMSAAALGALAPRAG